MADASASKQPDPAPKTLPSTPAKEEPTASKPPASSQASDAPKLSNADIKKQKKAEKAARRAQEKGDSGAAPDASQKPPSKPTQRRPSQPAAPRPDILPARTRPAQQPTTPLPPKEKEPREKPVPFFAHLPTARRDTLEGSPRDVHPQIQALGLQSARYRLTGSHARCAAMLLALKSVVQSYNTPPDQTLNRHLNSAHLSPQLSFLKSCRPFAVAQANAIRWLKNVIAKLDPNIPETTAKTDICRAIDTFIRERLTVADQVIAEAAAANVSNGDVVLTFGKSAVVTLALQTAAAQGKTFSVRVIDSRPLFEGRACAAALSAAGIDVAYAQISGLAHAARGADKCLLGAHAVLGNGRLYSRAGTALVAMAAHQAGAHVVVCAESIKFTERVALDAIVMNELAAEDELVADAEEGVDSLANWRKQDRLQLLNPLFDVTPAEYISAIVTELGTLPPSSAPVVQRMSAGAQEGEGMVI